MGYWAGVDLGTTYTAAAVAMDDRVEVVDLGTRTAVIPSVVVVRDDSSVLVGEAAARRAAAEPERAAREFKRRLGDPTPLFLGGAPYGAESLMAMLLRSVLDDVAESQGASPDGVAITHPASYGPYKLDLLRLAAEQAGVADALLVPEPVGAAIHYATLERIEPGEVVAVYDFGGGTFDAAVLRRTADSFEVIGTPVGLERLGGIDIDEAIVRYVDDSLGGALGGLAPDDPAAAAAVGRLRTDCQLAKEVLSEDTDTSIPVTLPGLSTEVRLTRGELEQMIRPRLNDTIDALRRSVTSAGLGLERVGRILLVGGTSRMPVVREAVAAATGRPVAVDAHPKHSVSLGAAAELRRTRAAAGAVGPAPALAATASAPDEPVVPVAAVAPVAMPARSRSTRRRTTALAVLGLVVLAVVSLVSFLGGDDDDGGEDLAAAGGPDATAEQSTTTSAGSAAVRRSGVATGDLALPRTVRYADLDITVESVEVEEGDEFTPDKLVLVASMTNPLERTQVYLAFSTVELVVGDTELLGTASGGPGYADPGQTVDAVYDFPLDDVDAEALDLGTAVLRISDDGDVPVELPLGDAPEPAIPTADVVPPGDLAAVADGLLFHFTSGTVTYDEGTDLGGTEDAAARRAADGSAFVRLFGTVTAQCGPDRCPGGLLASSGDMRLVVDGSPTPPVNLSFNEVLAADQRLDIEVVWEVPLGATSYAVRYEGHNSGPVDAPIEIPSL